MAGEKSKINPKGLPGDYNYGILNSIDEPLTRQVVDSYGADALSAIASAAGGYYKPDTLKNTGPYRGVVLRIEPDPDDASSDKVFTDPDDASFLLYGKGDKAPSLVRIKVRIPELDAHLSPPSNWGDVEGDHHRTINMHTTFVAQNENVEQPKVGDLVWVDFTNKNNFKDPIYLEPVETRQSAHQRRGGSSARGSFNNCGRSSSGGGVTGISDRTPSVAYAANQNYPQGTRFVPEGEETVIIESGQGNGAMEPEKKIKPILERMSQRNDLLVKGWAGRLSGNGGRNVVIVMPLTTNLENPFELIYHFHGANSWFSGNTPNHIFSNMKTLSEGKRNVVIVYPQMPWSGSGKLYQTQMARAGGSELGTFFGPPYGNSKGGNFVTLHQQVLNVIGGQLLGADSGGNLKLDFLTMTCHSRGGIALAILAATGQLREVAPDKITLGDGDYGWGGPPREGAGRRTDVIFGTFAQKDRRKYINEANFPPELLTKRGEFGQMTPSLRVTDLVWQYYVSSAGKNVEYNLLVISPERIGDNVTGNRGNFPRAAAQELLKTRLQADVPGRKRTTYQVDNGGGTAYVTYVPLVASHGQIGIQHAITYVGSDRNLPKDNNKDKQINPDRRDSMPTSEAMDNPEEKDDLLQQAPQSSFAEAE